MLLRYALLGHLILCVFLTNAFGQNRRLDNTNIPNHKYFADELIKADSVQLYEGLPHQMFEGDLLQSELKAKKTTRIGGFPFYQRVLPLKKQDRNMLNTLLTNPESFRRMPQDMVKMCGGFHPDYCITWLVGEKRYHCLVCFGCKEIKVLGPRGELFYCEITRQACAHFEKILKPYQKNRPKRNGD